MAFDPQRDDIMDSVIPSPAEIRAAQQATYEIAVCKKILRAAGLEAAVDRELAAGDEQGGKLTLEKVYQAVQLPLWLVAKHIKVGKALGIAMEGKITKTSVWHEFQLIKDCIPGEYIDTKAIGLVFPWHGDTRFKVFHNWHPLKVEDLSHYGRWYRVHGKLFFLENLIDALKVWLG